MREVYLYFDGDSMTTQKGAAISARILAPLKTLIQEFVAKSTYMNESDFIRNAIREKIQRDAAEKKDEESEPT